MAKPIISADSHITEPPNTYVDRIDAVPRSRARTSCAIRSAATSSSSRAGQADSHGPRGRGRQACRGADRCSAPGSRRCTAAAGTRTRGSPIRTRRRGRGDPVPDRRDDALQPSGLRLQARVLRRPTTSGSASTASAHPDRLLGIGQTAMRSVDDGHPRSRAHQGARPSGRDDAGEPGARGLRRSDVRPVLGGRHRPGAAAVVSHPHQPE